MNKLLVLLYIILSYSLCKECSESDCESITLENGEERSHYACVPKDDDTCELKLLCSYASTGDPETIIQCSNYPAIHPDKICVSNGEEACKEEYNCETVPSTESEKACSSYEVSDIAKYVCEQAKGEEGDDANICSKFALSESNNKNYICQQAEQGSQLACKKIPFCSYVTPQQGTEIDCSTYPLENTNGDTVCIPKEDAEYICQEKYLCDKVPKGITEACNNFVLEEDKKYTHYCTNSDGDNACKIEKYQCNDVPKIPAEKNIECSSFLDLEKTATHVCIEDTTSQTKQCKEMKLCSQVTTTDMTGVTDCSSSFYYDKETYDCRLNENGDKCEQVYLCEKAESGLTDEECSKYVVKSADKGCIKDSTEGKFCKEVDLCTKVSLETATDAECNKYPVSFDKIKTHICVKNQANDGTSCVEQPLCDEVQKSGVEEVDCQIYPVKNKETNICVENPNPTENKACKEKMLCEKKTNEATDEECRELAVKVGNQGKYACIANTQNGASGCIEEKLCLEVETGDEVDCSKYPLSDNNKDTHICREISNPTDKACEEIPKSEINCEEAKNGKNDKQCSGYKVLDNNKRCAVNKDNQPTSPCKEIGKCELKTTGATYEEICALLAVEKPGEEKCVRNPEGENCMLLTYCDYAEGNSDEVCSKFALKNIEQNECKKKSGENKCEEVKKKTEDEPDEESGNDESLTSDKDGSKTDSDKASSTTEQSQAGEGNQDTAKSTEGTTGKNDNDNDNSGNIINIAFGLSLIIYVLFLF